MTRRTSADMMGGFSKSPTPKSNKGPAPAQEAPVKVIELPKGSSADIREIDNGKIVRVHKDFETVREIFIPDGQDVIVG